LSQREKAKSWQLLPFLLSFISAMKLSEWARRQGISYLTAYGWFRAGKLPVPARQLPSIKKAWTNERTDKLLELFQTLTRYPL
jgi:hypothetical protein